MNFRTTPTWLAAICLPLAALTACAGGGDQADSPADKVGQIDPNGPSNPDPADLPDVTVLSHISGGTLDVALGQSADLVLSYTDAAGNPISGGNIDLSVPTDSDLSLEALTAVTGADGTATVRVFAGMTTGSHRVLASATNAEDLSVTVRTSSPDSAAYIVVPSYAGAQLDRVEVMLLPQGTACDTLDPLNMPAPAATEVVEVFSGDIGEVWFADLDNGSKYTIAAVGYLNPNVLTAMGCTDALAPITAGQNQDVPLPMLEQLPEMTGAFDVETRVDLVDALPEPWGSNIDFVGMVFTNPGRAMANVLFGNPETGSEGVLGDILGSSESLRLVAEGVINDLLTAYFGDQIQQYFTPGGSAYRTLTQFTLTGQIALGAEPMPTGQLQAGTTSHAYDTISVYWTEGCAPTDTECGRTDMPLDAIAGMGLMSSEFTGQVISDKNSSVLAIDRHNFDFNYGAIALVLFESVVLPNTFGVNDISQALSAIIDCGAVADEFFPSLLDIIQNQAVNAACDEALDVLVDEVRDKISGADLGAPGISLATSSEGQLHCPLTEPTYTADDRVRRYIGLGDDEARCNWDARFDAEADSSQIPADFFGTR